MQQIKIDVIDNGFILSYIRSSVLTGKPEAVVEFFATIKEITEVLNKLF